MAGYIEQAARKTDGVAHTGTDFAVGLSLVVIGGGLALVFISTGGVGIAAAATIAGHAGFAQALGSIIDRRRPRQITERIETAAFTVFMDEPKHAAANAVLTTTVDGHSPHWVCTGSSTVFIEGWNASRLGDTTSCGGIVQEGSETIFTGGEKVNAPGAPDNPSEVIGEDLYHAYSTALMIAGWRALPSNSYEAIVYGAARVNDAGILSEHLSPALLAEGAATRSVAATNWARSVLRALP